MQCVCIAFINDTDAVQFCSESKIEKKVLFQIQFTKGSGVRSYKYKL